jgi:ABC-2 type transport system ATP-binding protein
MDHGKIIALGSPRELVASLGVEHVVEFSVEGQQPLDGEALRALDGVRDVRADGGVVRMQVTALHSAMPALLAELVRRGVRLTELRTHSATLEDVFVTLTGRHLRDA